MIEISLLRRPQHCFMVAEAYYGVPDELKAECRKRLNPDMLAVLDQFDTLRKERISAE